MPKLDIGVWKYKGGEGMDKYSQLYPSTSELQALQHYGPLRREKVGSHYWGHDIDDWTCYILRPADLGLRVCSCGRFEIDWFYQCDKCEGLFKYPTGEIYYGQECSGGMCRACLLMETGMSREEAFQLLGERQGKP